MPGNGVLIEQRFPLPRGLVRRLDRLAVQFGLTRLEVVMQLLDQGTRGVMDGRRQRVRRVKSCASRDLAAARTVLEDYAEPRNWIRDEMERWVFIDEGEPWARAAEALAGLVASPALCASCGQDRAGGYNAGCPDGAGL